MAREQVKAHQARATETKHPEGAPGATGPVGTPPHEPGPTGSSDASAVAGATGSAGATGPVKEPEAPNGPTPAEPQAADVLPPTGATAKAFPPLPSEHMRPGLGDFMRAGYQAEDYERTMEEWETRIRERMAEGLSYAEAVNRDGAEHREKVAPAKKDPTDPKRVAPAQNPPEPRKVAPAKKDPADDRFVVVTSLKYNGVKYLGAKAGDPPNFVFIPEGDPERDHYLKIGAIRRYDSATEFAATKGQAKTSTAHLVPTGEVRAKANFTIERSVEGQLKKIRVKPGDESGPETFKLSDDEVRHYLALDAIEKVYK